MLVKEYFYLLDRTFILLKHFNELFDPLKWTVFMNLDTFTIVLWTYERIFLFAFNIDANIKSLVFIYAAKLTNLNELVYFFYWKERKNLFGFLDGLH